MTSHEQRFWRFVEKTDGCWLWRGAIQHGHRGYGVFKWTDRQRGAHRIAYEILVGPIPEGLVLDHLCRVRHCVNPAHLEPVTHRENLLRGETRAATNFTKTHCIHGHPFDTENTRFNRRGQRICRACTRRRKREYQEATKREAAA